MNALILDWAAARQPYRTGAEAVQDELAAVLILAGTNEVSERVNLPPRTRRDHRAERTYALRGGRSITLAVGDHVRVRKNDYGSRRADALFAAHGSGATKAEIRRRTGRSRDEIAAALKTGRLSAETRAFAQGMECAWTLDELALLAEFEGDEAALARIKSVAGRWGRNVRYAVEYWRPSVPVEVELVTACRSPAVGRRLVGDASASGAGPSSGVPGS
ncbi:hypothetical protein ACIBHY_52520 [Nonomuraea sp. NPDC050547]|uniref:hypothetical protein n=1 Tax=Nonomuraea sp. NPDC050547 TaxID=3364368 RepID=UPI0037AF3C20